MTKFCNYFFSRLLVLILMNYGQALKNESIRGGAVVDICEHPYQIALHRDGQHECGGGIFDKYRVLTAAHCVMDENKELRDGTLFVITAVNSLRNIQKISQKIEVTKMFVPNNYNPETNEHDISLLVLKTPLKIGPEFCTRALKFPQHDDFKGKEAKLVGHGFQSVEYRQVYPNKYERVRSYASGKLHLLDYKVISNSQCQKMWLKPKKWMLGKFITLNKKMMKVTDSFLCALPVLPNPERAVGGCGGDSGSPLVVNGNTVIGIYSTGTPTCVENERPSLYARVYNYRHFIENSLSQSCHVGYTRFRRK